MKILSFIHPHCDRKPVRNSCNTKDDILKNIGVQNNIGVILFLSVPRKKAIDVYNDVHDNHMLIFGFLFYEYLVSSFTKKVCPPVL